MNRLIQAAFELFVIRGYHATSLEAISSKAGLTKGSVYFYFGSKEKLILHMFEVLREDLVDGLVATLRNPVGSHVDRIIRYIHKGADFGAERPNELLFMIQIAIEFARQRMSSPRQSGSYTEMYTPLSRRWSARPRPLVRCRQTLTHARSPP